MNSISPKVLIISAGAIGGFYGALLSKAGEKVSVVCRSDYEHVKTTGHCLLTVIILADGILWPPRC
jgi:2-dehydropantoate 2-reductase